MSVYITSKFTPPACIGRFPFVLLVNSCSVACCLYSSCVLLCAQSLYSISSYIAPSNPYVSCRPHHQYSLDCSKSTENRTLTFPALSSTSSLQASTSKYPLYPSVVHLLHKHGLSASAAKDIKPSGPNGRLLKGDVLAHVGKITASYPSESANRLAKLGKLDLSNIQLLEPTPAQKTVDDKPLQAVEKEIEKVDVSVNVDLTSLDAMRTKIQDSLGIQITSDTLIQRATEVANREIVRKNAEAKTRREKDVFEMLIAAKPRASRRYMPVLTERAVSSVKASTAAHEKRQDVFEMLLGGSKKQSRVAPKNASGASSIHVLSVKAGRGEEKRVAAFLDNVKTALETRPGSLVL